MNKIAFILMISIALNAKSKLSEQPKKNSFYKYVQPATMLNHGDITGFKLIKTLPKQHPLSILGAKKDDIILSVNDIKISNLSTIEKAYQQENIYIAHIYNSKTHKTRLVKKGI